MEPADLAKLITKGKDDDLLIFGIGPTPIIKQTMNIGVTCTPLNLSKLETQLIKLLGI